MKNALNIINKYISVYENILTKEKDYTKKVLAKGRISLLKNIKIEILEQKNADPSTDALGEGDLHDGRMEAHSPPENNELNQER